MWVGPSWGGPGSSVQEEGHRAGELRPGGVECLPSSLLIMFLEDPGPFPRQ